MYWYNSLKMTRTVILLTAVYATKCACENELHTVTVDVLVQCETFCRYVTSCHAYTYSHGTHECQVWETVKSGRTPVLRQDWVNQNTCGRHHCYQGEVCLPTSHHGPGYLCTKYELKLWATEVLGFSSQYPDSRWFAKQILGPPDVYPQYGDLEGAWAASARTCTDGSEWIQVKLSQQLRLHRVQVYETDSAGLLSKLYVGSTSGGTIDTEWNLVWTNPTLGLVDYSRIFQIDVKRYGITTDRIMLETDCHLHHWIEYDAVAAIGLNPRDADSNGS